MLASAGLLIATPCFAQKELTIAEIQGSQAASPHVSASVKFTGIVTGKMNKAFYVQTPDDKADKDAATSEGIMVYGEISAGEVSVGDLVEVVGTVTEFRPKGQSFFLTITEITRPTVKVISKGNALPAPIVLTSALVDPKGTLDQLEKFEGMRVTADVTVVAPTSGFKEEKTGIARSNGVFFAVIEGTPRPFREPGVDVISKMVDKLPSITPAFDMNPELLRIDSSAQTGSTIMDVPAGATIKKLTGIIEYSRKFYTILLDGGDRPIVEGARGFTPVSPAGERELTVGSFNIENFFDDETNSKNVEKETVYSKEVFRDRLKKVSLAVRHGLAMPDILGIVEVENLKVLEKVAAKINTDGQTYSQIEPKYTAYLEEGNDPRGIDVGFLVRSSKVKVIETKQLAKDEKFEQASGPAEKLFDRPPLMLRAEVIDAKAPKPLAVTVVVNHIKSYRGIDDAKDGDRNRNKRRLQAEWLAKFVAERQKADPNENIILCGDFNAYPFNDGYNDLMGTLKGRPDPSVLNPTKMPVETGLANLVDHIDAKNRYSYTYDGSAQAIDHILINKPLRGRLLKFGFARVNADFPLVWSNDANRPERVSDHDAPVVFLSLDEGALSTPAAAPQR